MKRLLLVFVAAAAALGMWLAFSGGSLGTASTTATSLLPVETLAFLHVPDVEKTRLEWYDSDLFKLWSEPAVQEFLAKPLANAPRTGAIRDNADELQPLGMKDAFLALVSWQNDRAKIAGGFRFRGTPQDAERVIGKWRTRLQENAPEAKRETVTHRHHRIEMVQKGNVAILTVYHRDLFLAANDLELLKTLLDRVDGDLRDSPAIGGDESFKAASKHMPADYAAMGYARVDQYLQNLRAKMPADAGAGGGEQLSALQQIRSVAAATKFENGKVRDVLFVGMPRGTSGDALTRASLAVATAESFLYHVTVLRQPFTMPPGLAAISSGMPAVLRRLGTALQNSGVTMDEWNSAFGPELGVVGDWPEQSRIPALLATVPVKDATAANRLLTKLTAAAGEGAGWTQSNKGGVQYFSLPPPNPMVPLSPTIAIGEQAAIAGLNPISVEAALERANGSNSQLAATDTFSNAQQLVPAAEQSFTYIDTALLYRRLDAALRPMLIMSAAFLPNISQSIDLSKVPAPDVITRHLSPLVVSQNYRTDGYVTESVGPFSMYAAGIGIAAATGASALWYQRNAPGTSAGGTMGTLPPPIVAPSPALPVSTPAPDETPEPEG